MLDRLRNAITAPHTKRLDVNKPIMKKISRKIMEVDEEQAKLLRKKFGNSTGIPAYFYRDDRNCFHFYPRASKGLLIRQKSNDLEVLI